MQDQRASVVRDVLKFHGVNYFTQKIERNIVEDVLIVPEWHMLRHACVGACTIEYSFFLPMHHDANNGHQHCFSVRAGRMSLTVASPNACCHRFQTVGTHLQRLTSTWHGPATNVKYEELCTMSLENSIVM